MAPISSSTSRIRKSFGKIKSQIEIPDLISIQKSSYARFLQKDIPVDERHDVGLQAVFKSVFPIKDFNETASLEFVSYHLDKPKYDVDECHQRGMTFAAPVKVVIRLVLWDQDSDGDVARRTLRDVKEQEVYFGEIPLMTENGTFIINGTERVVVSQLHRSPGVFYSHDRGRSHASGKLLYSCRVIPYRGSWLDFEFDAKDHVYVRIDRRRKMLATVLLRALGFSPGELLQYYYDQQVIHFHPEGGYSAEIPLKLLHGQRATIAVADPKTGRVLVKAGRKFTKRAVRELRDAGVDRIPLDEEGVLGAFSAEDVVDPVTGEIVVEVNEELTAEKVERLKSLGFTKLLALFINPSTGPYLRNTLAMDQIDSPEEALEEIYRRLRPGDPPTEEAAYKLFHNLFFNPERYDLSQVGRLKLNYKFEYTKRGRQSAEFVEQGWKQGPPVDFTVLTRTDILEAVRYLVHLRNGRQGYTIDDIDHLGNRRVRAVGELMENQYRIGLVRMERAIKERMSMSQELETLMPHDLINSKPVSAVVKEYFGSSQLSQFMDQTNPLSEVTHKRRLSALGPGGLTRERAGFEVRDVHSTHYGRICPIETPEGPNIGLIASLSTYAQVNRYGFVETPYRPVEGGKLKGEPRYYSALEEEDHIIAQANTRLKGDRLADETIACHQGGDVVIVKAEDVSLMDVSPNQLVSVAASLIPFLENDDANRALMGSNMQRQAVPLLRADAPLVGTGMEQVVAHDSGVTLVARHGGVVESVDAGRIVVRVDDEDADSIGVKPDIYNLIKFQRSNQNTCINQRPIVSPGQRVNAGDIIADGPSTERGDLALGQNVVVAFMPWGGYNFEDAILISERLVRDDVYTSIHVEEFECVARDTKLGPEEITRDIPNVGEEALKDLDESGIIRIGAEVKPNDILVGKITPKGETQLSPEEKLLRAIFGEKAGDVRDTSLRVPPGVVGTVISAKVFARRGIEKDERTREIEDLEEAKLLKDQNDEIKIVRDAAYDTIRARLRGKVTAAKLIDESGRVLLPLGATIGDDALGAVPQRYWGEILLKGDPDTEDLVRRILQRLDEQSRGIKELCQDKISRMKKGDELAPGVIKMVKVYVAIKRKLQVGDKMAGRHGNKGVISQVLPIEDMPYLTDGRPVDIVLNPLGVPSRMNVGQILETHLGWAAKGLGERIGAMLEAKESARNLRDYLLKVFGDQTISKRIKDASAEEVRAFARELVTGVHVATPVFDGATEDEIRRMLSLAALPTSGQMVLFDGRSGEPFDRDVTVGVMYMLKLHHLVDDKIHARSIGPYSLVTQQPLGGKAQFGGQRLGEMEVWAMEAYGAAYGLQEFLTVKSDDVLGRTRMYEAIVKGDYTLEAGLPESFNVLLKEIQALGLDVDLVEEGASGDAGPAAEADAPAVATGPFGMPLPPAAGRPSL